MRIFRKRTLLTTGCLAALLFNTPAGARQDEPMKILTYDEEDSLLRGEREALRNVPDLDKPFGRVNALDLIEMFIEEDRVFDLPHFVRTAQEEEPKQIGDITRALISLRDRIVARDRSGETAAELVQALPALKSSFGASGPGDARRLASNAELKELDLLAGPPGDLPGRRNVDPAALEKFAREHPGSEAGAKALYFLAWANVFPNLQDRQAAERVASFMETIRIAAELDSGKFPPGVWADGAASRAAVFNLDHVQFSVGDYDQIVAAYKELILRRLDNKSANLDASKFIVLFRIPALLWQRVILEENAGAKTDEETFNRLATKTRNAVNQVFEELTRKTKDPDGARYLQALYEANSGRQAESGGGLNPWTAESIRILESLSMNAVQPWKERALATLASELFETRDYKGAAAAYRRYLNEFPRSDSAWVAAIRLGQAQVETRDFAGGRKQLRDAAKTYAKLPAAHIAALAFAAQASAALGDFDGELEDLKSALEAWDPDLTDDFEVGRPSSGSRPGPPTDVPGALTKNLDREALSKRADDLPAKLKSKDQRSLEGARWWIEYGDPDRALEIAESLLKSSNAAVRAEAASLSRRARLDRALAWVDVRAPRRDEAGAAREFEALASASQDFTASAARMARAALAWKQTNPDEARRWMREGLEALQKLQQSTPVPPKGSIGEDVAAIQDATIGPRGPVDLLVWDSSQGFLPQGPHPWLFAPSVTEVISAVDGIQEVTASRSLQRLPNLLFLDPEQAAVLSSILSRYGANPDRAYDRERRPAAGASPDILVLVAEFFPAMPNDRLGWSVFRYPWISSIEFGDGRTKATAFLPDGLGVTLEKRDGVWKVTGMREDRIIVN
jgi:hypothetical protein